MDVLDLFSGIGGFALGLERAGLRTVAFCETDPFCRAVLLKHWPHVRRYADVRRLTAARLTADGIAAPAVICGGFPCQDISSAGNRCGIDGERSGLWSEFARLIRELRPRYAIVENVPDLRCRGLGAVLGDLAALGYDAEWHCIPAAAVGAAHVRNRLWIVAYTGPRTREVLRLPQLARVARERGRFAHRCADVWQFSHLPQSCRSFESEPGVGRVADGIPGRVERLAALGNAVVPQLAELIGRAIME